MALLPALSIAQRALIANETALTVTGNNIANANTPGYTRQVPELLANDPVRLSSGILVGTGVHVDSVQQVLDPLLERRLLRAGTDSSEQSALSDRLGALAGVLNDLDTPSLGSVVSDFFDAADAVARNPEGLAERQTLLSRAGALTRELARRYEAVGGLQREADQRYVAGVTRANDLLGQLADLNQGIVTSETSGQKANELRDQRRLALGELAGIVGIATVENADGSVTVSAADGTVLVAEGDVVHALAVRSGGAGLDGTALHDAGFVDPAGGFLPDAAAFTTGELAGLAAARDNYLPTAAGALDTLAVALRDQVNAVQTDPAARDLDGNPTAAVPLFGGTGASDLTVLVTDPRNVAAALSAEPGDNQNALRLADLRTTRIASLGDLPFTGYVAERQGQIGEDAARAEDAAKATQALQQQLQNQHESVAGVNLNEELTNLLKYQRAFQAASQVIGVTNGMLDELFKVF